MHRLLLHINRFFKQIFIRKSGFPTIQIEYPSRWILFFVALFIGAFMVLYAGPKLFGEAIKDPEFYKAWWPSSLAAYIALTLVSRSFNLLDESHSWYRGWLVRLAMQLCHGVIIPSLVLLGFFTIYFIERGHPNMVELYYRLDFYFAVAMVVGVNIIYFRYFWQRTADYRRALRAWQAYLRRRAQPDIVYLGTTPDTPKRLPWKPMLVLPAATVQLEGQPAANDEPEEAGFFSYVDIDEFIRKETERVGFYRTEGLKNAIWSYRKSGTKAIEEFTYEQLAGVLAGRQFFAYHKGCIVNRDAIAECYKKGRYWYMVMGGAYEGTVLRVSREKAGDFEAWYH